MLDFSSSAVRATGYLILAVVAAILIASHTPLGAALSMDSLYYLSTAGNILEGNGITRSTHLLSGPALQSTTLWPPLYPLLVAAIMWVANLVGTSEVVGIAVFNSIALIATMYLVVRIASLAASVQAGIAVAFAIAISPSIQIVFTYAWSEVLFIPLCLAAYIGLQQYLTGDDSARKSGLYAMIVFLGLATYTRYVGLAFFSSAALGMLIYGRGDLPQRLRTVTAATLAYLVFLLPMLLRNLVQAGTFSGGQRGSPDTNVLSDIATLMWYLYLEFLNLPVFLGAAVIVVAVVSAAWLFLRRTSSSEQGALTQGLTNIVVPFLFVFIYMIFLLVSRGRQSIDLDSRMLSVVIPFLAIGFLGVYQQLVLRVGRRLAVLPFLLPLAAFVVGAFQTHTSILKGWRDLGEPGLILGMTYRSMTSQQMDVLRGISEHFVTGRGDLVLTDISRPIIVEYLFPGSDVRQVPGKPNDQNIAELEASLQRDGIVIVGDTDWSQALSTSLEGRAHSYTISDQAGIAKYVVITLPVDVK
jgi:hypothetical protein